VNNVRGEIWREIDVEEDKYREIVKERDLILNVGWADRGML
jgi:hypothetical protein